MGGKFCHRAYLYCFVTLHRNYKIGNKMATIEFTENGKYWVSPTLTGDDNGNIPFQLGFNTDGAKLHVDFTLDESVGWSNKAVILCPRMPELYGNIVTGATEGISVRLRTNKKPTVAIINE